MALSTEDNFGISQPELTELMSRHREDAVAAISERGGLAEIARQLRTDLQRGISTSSGKDLNSRCSHFGVNRLPQHQRKSMTRTVCESCLLVIFTIVSKILKPIIEQKTESAAVWAWVEGAAILGFVLIIVVIRTVLHESKEWRQRDQNDVTGKVAVIRNGNWQEVPEQQLVVGDVVQITSESTLPTDGLLIQGSNIMVDESNFTGKSDLIVKNNERDPILLAGTQMIEGEGTMLVTAMGPHSQQGIILYQQPEDKEGACSSLCNCVRFCNRLCCSERSRSSNFGIRKSFSRIQQLLFGCGVVAALISVLALSLQFAISELSIIGRSWNTTIDLAHLLQFAFIGIAVEVVASPEGILIAIPLSYGYSIRKMSQDGNIVRYISAVFELAEVTSVVIEKSGILTTNQFAVVESYFAGKHYTSTVTLKQEDLPDDLFEVLKLAISVNSDYNSKLESLTGKDKVKYTGSVTECALLAFLRQLGIDYEAIRETYPMENIVKVFPLKTATKNRSTVIQMPGGGYRILTTGAAETVLHKCTHALNDSGKVSTLDDEEKRGIMENIILLMASGAQRVVALAYRDFPTSTDVTPDWEDADAVISNLTLIGITGIQDPLRPEVFGFIKFLQEAGITVRIATGDNIQTARVIAEKCGIIRKGKEDDLLVLDGKEFNRQVMDVNGYVVQQKLDKIWPQLRVLAGCSPTDKYNLVSKLALCQGPSVAEGVRLMLRSKCDDSKRNKEVIAFIGRGTSDGPAMKAADVAIAMGSERSDVADRACDIITHSDNFTSVMKAVLHSRNISASISRFLQFQLTVNIVAILLTIIAAVTTGESPLQGIHLLWIYLIMDVLSGLALTMEPPTTKLLKRKPYGKNSPLISKQMWVFMLGHSIYQLIVLLIILFAGPVLFNIDSGVSHELGPSQHYTLVFNTFVMFQLFNEVNARKVLGERNVFGGLWQNRILLVIMIIQIMIQIIIVQFGYVVFHTSRLTLDLWLWCIFLGSTELLIGQLLTLIPLQFLSWFSSSPVDTPDPKIRMVDSFRDVHGSTENTDLPHQYSTVTPITGIETTV